VRQELIETLAALLGIPPDSCTGLMVLTNNCTLVPLEHRVKANSTATSRRLSESEPTGNCTSSSNVMRIVLVMRVDDPNAVAERTQTIFANQQQVGEAFSGFVAAWEVASNTTYEGGVLGIGGVERNIVVARRSSRSALDYVPVVLASLMILCFLLCAYYWIRCTRRKKQKESELASSNLGIMPFQLAKSIEPVDDTVHVSIEEEEEAEEGKEAEAGEEEEEAEEGEEGEDGSATEHVPLPRKQEEKLIL
jgi:preprotein translocase subunit SecG